MKKNGFTLVELTISVVLIGIASISMVLLLGQLGMREEGLKKINKMKLNTIFISKQINNDIIENGKIRSIECTDKQCDITFNNNGVGQIVLSPDSKQLTYKSGDRIKLKRTIPNSTTYNYSNIIVEKKQPLNNGLLVYIVIGIEEMVEARAINHPEYAIEIVDY